MKARLYENVGMTIGYKADYAIEEINYLTLENVQVEVFSAWEMNQNHIIMDLLLPSAKNE